MRSKQFYKKIQCYHSILGVSVGATKRDIDAAYRAKVMECHPDKGGNPQEFKLVQEAYEFVKKIAGCAGCAGADQCYVYKKRQEEQPLLKGKCVVCDGTGEQVIGISPFAVIVKCAACHGEGEIK